MEFRLTRRQKIIQYPRLWYFLSTATVQMVLERKALAWDLLRYLQNDFNEVKIIQDEKLYTFNILGLVQFVKLEKNLPSSQINVLSSPQSATVSLYLDVTKSIRLINTHLPAPESSISVKDSKTSK